MEPPEEIRLTIQVLNEKHAYVGRCECLLDYLCLNHISMICSHQWAKAARTMQRHLHPT
jgi:hypothetical protein